MTYQEPEYDTDENEEAEEQESPKQLRDAVTRSNKKAQEAEQKLAQIQRDRAFEKAGINLEDELGQMFSQHYQGDLEVEQIREAAGRMNIPVAGQPVSEAPDTSTQERQQVASGSMGDTGERPPEPVRGKDGLAVTRGRQILESGGNREDAQGEVLATLAEAAIRGDRSVIVYPEDE